MRAACSASGSTGWSYTTRGTGCGPAAGGARHRSRFAAEPVKIWADGGMSSRTAAIHGTYPVPPYGSGILYFERDELTEMVRRLDALGFQVCIHAQGDRA